MTRTQDVRQYLEGLQQRITGAFGELDGTPFAADRWRKAPGEPLQGEGVSMILEGGNVFERPGCRRRRRSTGPTWPARRSRRWVCRWSSIRAIRTRRPCT
jgi:coproporphyrinogen III oxidase